MKPLNVRDIVLTALSGGEQVLVLPDLNPAVSAVQQQLPQETAALRDSILALTGLDH